MSTVNDRSMLDTTIGPDGMHKNYPGLSDEDRAKRFVRPLRFSCVHATCGVTTIMGQELAETYARDPEFYSWAFCGSCKDHFRVGPDGEFTWDDGSKVGA